MRRTYINGVSVVGAGGFAGQYSGRFWPLVTVMLYLGQSRSRSRTIRTGECVSAVVAGGLGLDVAMSPLVEETRSGGEGASLGAGRGKLGHIAAGSVDGAPALCRRQLELGAPGLGDAALGVGGDAGDGTGVAVLARHGGRREGDV